MEQGSKKMALHPDFPKSPYAVLNPETRWFPADEALRETAYEKLLPPVGATETQADHDADRYGFTHQEMLDNVGLIHMNGRVYDPQLGRFLSVDPIFAFPTNTQSLNPYSYVLNNPLSLTDPTGYVTCNTGQTSCPDSSPETKSVSYTPTGSHIAITVTATRQADGSYAVTSNNPQMAQAIAHAAQAMFGSNGQQNRNNGPGSGADLGKTAQDGSLAHNTGGIAANTNAATGSQTQTNPSQGRIEQYVGQQANAYGVPTKIGIAVVQQESSFNPNAINKNRNKSGTVVSTDYGLMMINDKTFFGKQLSDANGRSFTVNGDKVRSDWEYNVGVGMAILKGAYIFAGRHAPDDLPAATYARYNAGRAWELYRTPGTQVYKDVQGFLKIYNGQSGGP